MVSETLENLGPIADIVTAFAAGIIAIVSFFYARRARMESEAIQAKQTPVIDIELDAKVEKYKDKRILFLEITIQNVGEVITTLVSLEITLWRFNPSNYPESTVLLNNKEILSIYFRKKICYKDLKYFKNPPELEDKCLVLGERIVNYDTQEKVLDRFDGRWENSCMNYNTDMILDYDYNVNEFRHFTFPIVIVGSGLYRVHVQGIFLRHRRVEGERILDVKARNFEEMPTNFGGSYPEILESEKWLGKTLLGYSEELTGFIPEDPEINHNEEVGNAYYSQREYKKAIRHFEMMPEAKQEEYRGEIARSYYNHARKWWDKKESGERAITAQDAISSMQKACEIYPEVEEYENTLNRLKVLSHCGEQYEEKIPVATPIAVELAADLIALIEGKEEGEGLAAEASHLSDDMKQDILNRMGVKVPGIRFRSDEASLPDGTYKILLSETPIAGGEISPNKRLFIGRLEKLTSLRISGQETKHPLTGEETWWIQQNDWKTAEEAGLELCDPLEYLFWHLQAVLENNLSEFLGHQEVMNLLDEKLTGDTYLEVVENPDNPLDLSGLAAVLRGLAREKVPIIALEAIVKEFNHCKKDGMNLLDVGEKIRSIPEILPNLPGNNDQYFFYQIGPILEEEINRSINRKHFQPVLNMDPGMCRDALTAVRENVSYQRNVAILVNNPQIRPFIKQLIWLEFPDIPVLSRNELLPHFESNIVGEIDIA